MTPETFTARADIEPRVQRAAKRFATDPHEHEDLCQEIRLDVLRYSRDDDPPHYVYRTAWARAYRHYRDEKIRAKYKTDFVPRSDWHDEKDCHDVQLSDYLGGLHHADSIEDEIIKREELELIETIAASLPTHLYRIFKLKMQGVGTCAIARRLGVSRRMISYYMPRIREAFQNHPLAALLFTEAIPS